MPTHLGAAGVCVPTVAPGLAPALPAVTANGKVMSALQTTKLPSDIVVQVGQPGGCSALLNPARAFATALPLPLRLLLP